MMALLLLADIQGIRQTISGQARHLQSAPRLGSVLISGDYPPVDTISLNPYILPHDDEVR
jgi:hypothetical protein